MKTATRARSTSSIAAKKDDNGLFVPIDPAEIDMALGGSSPPKKQNQSMDKRSVLTTALQGSRENPLSLEEMGL